VIGVDHYAFANRADERRKCGDRADLPRRCDDGAAQADNHRDQQHQNVGGAAEPAINQESLQIDVVLLQAEFARELEGAHAVREF
jgi:hypothetical protein